MKRKTNKIYLKIGILLFGISVLLFNCTDEKEFFGEPQVFGLFDHKHRKVSYKVGNEVPINIREFLYNRTSGSYQVAHGKSKGGFRLSKGQNKSNVFGTIDETSAIVVSLSTQTRYTFLIKQNIPNPNEVINLIIFDDALSTHEYFVKYEFDLDRQMRTAFNDLDMTKFSGTVSYFDAEGTLTGQYSVQNGTTSNSNGSGTPCPPDAPSDDQNEDPNDDSSDHSGGPGNGGCTVNCGGDDGTNNNDGGSDDGSTGGGEIENPDTCGLTWSYEPCCPSDPGSSEPHSPEQCGQCGLGNLNTLTVTNTCTGQVWRTNENDIEPFECDNTIGVFLKDDDCDTSKEDLKKIFPNASDSDMELLASVINDKGKDFGIDNAIKLQHFLAQAGHEVGGFNNGIGRQESLYYTTESRLKSVFKNYFWQNSTDTVNKRNPADYIKNSSKVANYVYADRMGNGNEASGEGYKYRGRGIFQLTGKTNYTNFKTWYNNKYDPDRDFIDKPELLKDNDTMAILSAMWYYKTEVLDRMTVDSTATVKKVTKKINGGKHGLPDRKARFTKAKDSIKCN